jgi:opacity protein-like surface antigen
MNKVVYLALIASAVPMVALAGGATQPIIEPVVMMPAAVVMMPGVDWTGGYAGVTLGYGDVSAEGGPEDAKAPMAGLNLGYRKDFGQFVLGGELNYSHDDINVSGGRDQVNSTTGAQVMLGADIGQTLVYVSGGYARANATVGGIGATDDGYSIGLGADYMLNDKWTVGAEAKSYTYADFNNSGVDLKNMTVGVKIGMRF